MSSSILGSCSQVREELNVRQMDRCRGSSNAVDARDTQTLYQKWKIVHSRNTDPLPGKIVLLGLIV